MVQEIVRAVTNAMGMDISEGDYMTKSKFDQIKKLKEENKELKEKLNRIQSKEPCWHCGGTGKTWTYWDGDTWCRNCSGTGML